MRGLNIIMIGPPCSGKGTHSKLIADKLDFQHISTGEIFREEISKKTALGVLAQSLIDHGNLIPDSVTMKVLYKKVKSFKTDTNLLFDGVPRTLPQAETLDKFIKKHNLKIDLVIFLFSPEDVLVHRMIKRSQKENRADDTLSSFQKRIKVYYEQTHILKEYYQKQGILSEVSTDAPIEDVAKVISKIIKDKLL